MALSPREWRDGAGPRCRRGDLGCIRSRGRGTRCHNGLAALVDLHEILALIRPVIV